MKIFLFCNMSLLAPFFATKKGKEEKKTGDKPKERKGEFFPALSRKQS